jgi:DNA-binding MarR family transcriptional regulator
MSIGQLSARTGVAKPNVTPLVDALRDRGYVSRTRNSEDRRMVNVHLEEEGAECLRKLREAVADQIRKWPNGITRSELRSLAASLETLSGVMNAFDEAQRT